MFAKISENMSQKKIFSLIGGKKFKKRILDHIKENNDKYHCCQENEENNSNLLGEAAYEMLPKLLRGSTSSERLGEIFFNNYNLIGIDKMIKKAKS